MAKEWGARQDRSGVANCYTIDCSDLTILDLNGPQYCILHWLSVLIDNREFDVPSPLAMQAKQYILKNFRVGSFQGYYYSKPIPPEQILKWGEGFRAIP